MKKIICLIIAGITINCAKAQLLGHEWKATLKVVDESNQPVAGANVEAWYYVRPTPANPNIAEKIEGLTDINGLFTASHGNTGSIDLSFRATKTGYYPTTQGHEFARFKDSDPNKWNPNLTLVLKKIGKPIPMYARREEMTLQKEDEPIGFDLMAGDWVAPNGTGTNADMFFTVHRKIINERQYNCTLIVTFPNKGDGIVAAPFEVVTGSEFQTSRTAAENGYESKLDLHYSNTNSPESVFGYFIRVRTELDENGNVKSALYGKISGDFKFYAGTIKPHSGIGFDYYLNPTSNDRNLEFDPKHNLSANLKLLEGVNAP
jgi:hypothetical protein